MELMSLMNGTNRALANTDSTDRAQNGILKRLTDIEETRKRAITMLSDIANLKEMQERNKKLTPRECSQIRKEINQRVSDVLGFKYENGLLTDDSLMVREKYLPMFMHRIYSDLKESEILSCRLSDTAHTNFTAALEKIRSWEPEQGVKTLKGKADQNRLARLQIDIGSGAKTGNYLSRRKQDTISKIRAQDMDRIRRTA